jgi:hypothetical protein
MWEAAAGADLATKADIAEVKAEIEELRAEERSSRYADMRSCASPRLEVPPARDGMSTNGERFRDWKRQVVRKIFRCLDTRRDS